MSTETVAGSEERLIQAVERLAEIQRSIQELHREAIGVRTHIRDFDFNMDALNILATVRSKYDADGGTQLLQDLIRYARRTGTPIGVHEVDVIIGTPDEPVRATVEPGMEHAAEGAPGGLLKLVSQLAVALAVTVGLFVLIH